MVYDLPVANVQSRLGKRLEITQNVAVKVKKAAEIELLKEPLCPQPEVRNPLYITSALPHLSPVRGETRTAFTVTSLLLTLLSRAGHPPLATLANPANRR